MKIPKGPESLDARWFTSVLRQNGDLVDGQVQSIRVEPFAEGVGLLGRLVRVYLQYDGEVPADVPGTLVVKFPSQAPENVALCENTRLYHREHSFYTTTAPHTPLRVPRAYYAAMESLSEFVLVLEDIDYGVAGNQIEGASEQQLRTAIPRVAEHHAAFWGRAMEGGRDQWLPTLQDTPILQVLQTLTQAGAEKLIHELPECFTRETRTVALTLAETMPALTRSLCANDLTFAHGDFRIDNLIFGETDAEPVLTAVDWQIGYAAPGPYDVAYLMTQSVEPALRRRCDTELLGIYHEALRSHGVASYSLDACKDDYRKSTTFCICYPLIAAGTLDLNNARGRALGKMMLDRALSAAEDVDSAGLLRALAA